MNITSKFPRNYTWLDVTVEEYGTKVQCSVYNIKEAEDLKQELTEVLNNLDNYIEKMQKTKL